MANYTTKQYTNEYKRIRIKTLNLHLLNYLNHSTFTVQNLNLETCKAGYNATQYVLSSMDEDEFNNDIICVWNKKNRQSLSICL